MSFSSGVRTQHGFGWVSVIWFMSAVCIIVSESVELQTISNVTAQCGDNVTLTCDAVSSQELEIRSFEWLARDKIVCQNGLSQPDHKVLCECGDHSLTLTLINVTEGDKGTYLCKLRSTSGSGSKNTEVTVQGCLGNVGFSTNELNVTQERVIDSSGNMVKLQWICMIVGVMMVKFMA